MKTIRYRVMLQEPAILTAIEGEPNSAVSYNFIPGAVMRGFFIGEAMRQYSIRDLDPTNEVTSRLFFSNRTRYLNLYPVVNDRRSLPVPVSWRKKKYRLLSEEDDKAIYDEVFSSSERNATEKMSNISGFVDYDPKSGQASFYKPERILNIHTQRARRSPNEQQVYRYDALAPGQSFEGLIPCENDEDASMLYDLMRHKQVIHIGGARSAGYGLAQIEVHPEWIMDEWWEVPHQPDSTIVLTLLSDVIVRDHLGQYSPTPDALKQVFERHGITFDYGDLSVQMTLVGGFNRKWGLPLPQTPALKHGSVLTLTNIHGSKDKLWELVRNGFGERTNEGFGQVALNWQRTAIIYSQLFEKPAISSGQQPKTSDGTEMWSRFETRIIQNHLDKAIETIFTAPQYRITGNISPSQLARLRTKIADELRQREPKFDFINTFLDDISGQKDAERTGKSPVQKAAGKQYEQARINGQSLMEWLRHPVLDFDDEALDQPESWLRLIDAVLERAQKERAREQKVRS